MTKLDTENRKMLWQSRRQMPLLVSIGLLAMILSFYAGCQRQDATIAGVTIPIPGEMKKLPDKMYDPIPGFEDGQASYRGRVAPGEIFTFYQENMEARGWKPTTFMGGEKDQYAYTKGNRICLVWYTRNDDGTTDLTIMVGPSRPPT
jgi:hypothetical protein